MDEISNNQEKERRVANGESADEILKCIAERDEYLNGWKRAKADLINYQREEAKRSEDLTKWSVMSLVRDLVPVLDSFDLALASFAKTKGEPEEGSRAAAGMERIRSQFEDALKRKGLARILVEKGSPFDPSIHEAVGEVVSEGPPGSIAEEVERGYELNGKVVRPTRVLLVKAKE